MSYNRDCLIIQFLWKWKIATTATIAAKFFPDAAVSTAYRRLWRLTQGGYLACRHNNSGRGCLWTLGKEGFKVAKVLVARAMREVGYKSEAPHHDLMVQAFQLGPWLNCEHPDLEFFTEQELRRFEWESYPEGIPQSDFHRPDGFTFIRDLQTRRYRIYAIEVELNLKQRNRYTQTFDYYHQYENISGVFWLVPRPKQALKLRQIIDHCGHSKDQHFHHTIDLKTYLRESWQAPIIGGPNEGQPIANKMLSGTIASDIHRAYTDPQHVVTRCMLNTAKAPHKSRSYPDTYTTKFFD